MQIAVQGRLGDRVGSLEALATAALVGGILAIVLLVLVRQSLAGLSEAVRPGVRPGRVVAALDLETERCRENGWPDLRSTCVGADILPNDVVVVYASYSW